jgi:transposase
MNQDMSVVGIDIAKRVFHVIGMDKRGKIILRKRLYRGEVMSFMAQLPRATVGMEACGGAHYWARQLRQQGHQVRLMAPQYVRPYVKTNKNDMRDAEAIAEAVTRPNMRFVPVKDVAQQDIQALHRVRERLVTARTALVHEMRGLLAEYGLVLPQGLAKFRKTLVSTLEAEPTTLTPLGRELFYKLFNELGRLEAELASYQEQLEALAHTHPVCQRLLTIPGIGPLTATALLAAVGDAQVFKNGRQFAAWLGLVPKQYSTGGQTRLLGISKRGDSYLRKLLIHGARATLRWARTKADQRSQWIRGLLERRGWNRTAVAVANKNARIVWVLLSRGGVYREPASSHHRPTPRGVSAAGGPGGMQAV